MVTLNTRTRKGSRLTTAEVDANWLAIEQFINASLPPATPWTPANLASTVAWWDAAEASSFTMSSGAVSAWRDKKNSVTATNSTAAQQPTYSATALNNLPGVTFDGSADRLAFPTNDFLPVGTAPITVLLVARGGAQAGDMAAMTWGSANRGGWVKLGEDGTGVPIGDLYIAGGRKGATTFAGATKILSYQATTTAASLYENGALGSASGESPADKNTSTSAGFIGMDLRVQGYWNGVIQEIIVCADSLSLADRQKWEGYAALKWNLRALLPSDHPYKSTGPTT